MLVARQGRRHRAGRARLDSSDVSKLNAFSSLSLFLPLLITLKTTAVRFLAAPNAASNVRLVKRPPHSTMPAPFLFTRLVPILLLVVRLHGPCFPRCVLDVTHTPGVHGGQDLSPARSSIGGEV
jgi:hypothetical protein